MGCTDGPPSGPGPSIQCVGPAPSAGVPGPISRLCTNPVPVLGGFRSTAGYPCEPTIRRHGLSCLCLPSHPPSLVSGMSATLGSACRVPLTSVLLLFELTRDYSLLVPVALATATAMQVCLSCAGWRASGIRSVLGGASMSGSRNH